MLDFDEHVELQSSGVCADNCLLRSVRDNTRCTAVRLFRTFQRRLRSKLEMIGFHTRVILIPTASRTSSTVRALGTASSLSQVSDSSLPRDSLF